MIRVSAWQNPGIVLVALVVIALVLYRDTALNLVRLWTNPENPTYSHGLLLVAVCAFLAFRRWPEVVKALSSRPNALGVLTVLGASLLWFLASLVGVLIVQQLSLLLLIGAIVLTVVGYRGARLLAVPMALMVFAVPVWEPLSPYLQHLTANMVTFLVNVSGIPAVLEGTAIWVPAGTFEVAPDCSGLAQLIVGMMVGVLYAYTTGQRLKPSLWLLAGVIGVSILSNTTRIYTVVIAGQLTGMRHYFVTTDHWTLGWVIFGICMAVFILTANTLTAPAEPSAQGVRPARGGGSGAAGKSAIQAAVLALGALMIGPALAYAYRYEVQPHAAYVLALPAQIGDWQALEPPGGYYRPSFVGPDTEYDKLYRTPNGQHVYLYIAYYATQRQGKEAVHYLNRVYDGKSWQAIANSRRSLNQLPHEVAETRIRSQGGREKTVWRWYYAGGTWTSSDYQAKLLNVWETLKGNPAMAVIVVAADVEKRGDGGSPAVLLERFMTDTLRTLERAIDKASVRT